MSEKKPIFKKQKTYGDYLREAADLNPSYRSYVKNYRKASDTVVEVREGSKEEND